MGKALHQIQLKPTAKKHDKVNSQPLIFKATDIYTGSWVAQLVKLLFQLRS